MEQIKIVIVGDGSVGKTCLVSAYKDGSFEADHNRTILDAFDAKVKIDNHEYQLSIIDTAGQHDFDRLRLISYPGTDIIIFCYDIANRESFEHIKSEWVVEVNKNCPTAKKFLVANKTDLRDNPDLAQNGTLLDSKEGIKLQKEINASQYMGKILFRNSFKINNLS